ncbi:MAG TPA: nucleotidyl transferase AbiEii/AbiGii toxin family protein, partial [Blastocatellia bacterium]|nr:nucleotidyl transferase AbiEii/AbiGii toxin family protein [Blastocatellia bacterium]
MKPLRTRLRNAALRTRVSQMVVEKDYALSYLLAGIAAKPELSETLIFKGGTALKKLYFGDYRFSEDLDFSAAGAPREQALEEAIREAVQAATRLLSAHGPFQIETARYTERDPHPGGQEAFIARVKFPWHPSPLCRIKVEITHDEPVLLEAERRALIHGYEEELAASLRGYPLGEVVAEKMRALLQTRQRLLQRGWNRPRARDYYDLWRILRDFGPSMKNVDLSDLLRRKSAHRGVSYGSLDDFFNAELEGEARRNWESNLKPFVSELPACDEVLAELKRLL